MLQSPYSQQEVSVDIHGMCFLWHYVNKIGDHRTEDVLHIAPARKALTTVHEADSVSYKVHQSSPGPQLHRETKVIRDLRYLFSPKLAPSRLDIGMRSVRQEANGTNGGVRISLEEAVLLGIARFSTLLLANGWDLMAKKTHVEPAVYVFFLS